MNRTKLTMFCGDGYSCKTVRIISQIPYFVLESIQIFAVVSRMFALLSPCIHRFREDVELFMGHCMRLIMHFEPMVIGEARMKFKRSFNFTCIKPDAYTVILGH